MPALLLKYISRLATNHLRRPKKAISVGKLTDLSSAGVQLGVFAATTVPGAWTAATAAAAATATGLACSLVHCAPCRTHVSADLGASKTVGVVTNPASAPMEDVPRCAFS